MPSKTKQIIKRWENVVINKYKVMDFREIYNHFDVSELWTVSRMKKRFQVTEMPTNTEHNMARACLQRGRVKKNRTHQETDRVARGEQYFVRGKWVVGWIKIHHPQGSTKNFEHYFWSDLVLKNILLRTPEEIR